MEKQTRANAQTAGPAAKASSTEKTQELKMWYCKQCGYVCLREDPPYICPICKAKRDLFAEVIMVTRPGG